MEPRSSLFAEGAGVGVLHIRLAYEVTAGGPGLKGVLLALADRACDDCGLAWPGIKYLSDRAELGETKTREAIRVLTNKGLLTVHGFAKGGRGLSTEYIVLPGVTKLSTAPCGKCREMMKRHHTGVGFIGQEPIKPITGRPKSHHTGDDHPSEIHNPSRARARERRSETASPSARSARGSSEPHSAAEVARQALAQLGITLPATARPAEGRTEPEATPDPGSPRDANPGSVERD
jgi:hypothetical protein